jgi:hypothetical protein
VPACVNREAEGSIGVQAQRPVPTKEVAVIEFVGINSHIRESAKDLSKRMTALGKAWARNQRKQH